MKSLICLAKRLESFHFEPEYMVRIHDLLQYFNLEYQYKLIIRHVSTTQQASTMTQLLLLQANSANPHCQWLSRKFLSAFVDSGPHQVNFHTEGEGPWGHQDF